MKSGYKIGLGFLSLAVTSGLALKPLADRFYPLDTPEAQTVEELRADIKFYSDLDTTCFYAPRLCDVVDKEGLKEKLDTTDLNLQSYIFDNPGVENVHANHYKVAGGIAVAGAFLFFMTLITILDTKLNPAYERLPGSIRKELEKFI